MQLVLAQPRGFCAGVVRAIDIVELALDVHSPPVFVYHDIVHNEQVVASLKQRGAVFVDDIDQIPEQSVTIFSAHGVSNEIVDRARLRRLRIIDATCPLVTKVHLQCRRFAAQGYTVIIVGHSGHQEVEGTRGAFTGPKHVIDTPEQAAALQVADDNKVAYVTQTTLSVDDTRHIIEALQTRFPGIQGPGINDICYATQNRQQAVRELATEVDLLLVVGASNSSNSNRLRELGEQLGLPSYLIQDCAEVQRNWLRPGMSIGITAGASAPEELVNALVDKLRQLGATNIRTMDGIEETTTFRLPAPLVSAALTKQTQPVSRET